MKLLMWQVSYLVRARGFGKALTLVASYCPVLEELAGVLAHLDVIVRYIPVTSDVVERLNYLRLWLALRMYLCMPPQHMFGQQCIAEERVIRSSKRLATRVWRCRTTFNLSQTMSV